MKKRKIILLISALFVFVAVVFQTGCGKQHEKSSHKKIDFTVCDESKMPKELYEIIEQKKNKIFKLSYINNDYLYIAVGYGEHGRENLNVVVEDLYLTENAIYIDTNLLTSGATSSDATSSGENDSNSAITGGASMYPYVVVKCEKYDLPVVFDID